MGLKLRYHSRDVAMYGEGRIRGIPAELIGGNVDLNELGGCVPLGRGSKMKNPIETGAEEADDIGFTKGSTSGAGGVQRVRVWKDTFSHRRGQKRYLDLGNERADGI